MKIETDAVEVLSGVRHGLTLGSPVSLLIRNQDHENWQDVMSPDPQPDGGASARRALKLPAARPRRPRGRAQVPDRRPAQRARAGQRARDDGARGRGRRWPRRCCATVGRRGAQPRRAHRRAPRCRRRRRRLGRARPRSRRARCAAPTPTRRAAMIAEIDRAKKAGDTVGGVFEVVARGVPPGLGLVRAVGPPARRPPRPGPHVHPGREGGGASARASRPARRRGVRLPRRDPLRRRARPAPRQQPRGRPRGRRHQRRGAARAGGGRSRSPPC